MSLRSSKDWKVKFTFNTAVDNLQMSILQGLMLPEHLLRNPMTESEWLVSTDPAAMFRFVEGRMTERQRIFFIEACRAKWAVPLGYIDLPPTSSQPRGDDGMRGWIDGQGIKDTSSVRCDILHDICGNPFRPVYQYTWQSCALCGQRVAVAGGSKYCEHPSAGSDPDGKNGHRWKNDILSWNNGIIPQLARSVYGEKCEACGGDGKGGHREHWNCETCWSPELKISTGWKSPPRWDVLPILADAVEDACEAVGCAVPEELTRHLRGQKRCNLCLGKGWWAMDGVCICETGWLPSDCGHCVGCFSVELLKGTQS